MYWSLKHLTYFKTTMLITCLSLFVTPVQIQCPSLYINQSLLLHSNLLLLLDWSEQDTCIPSPSIWLFLYNSSYLLQTPDNSNSFWFTQKAPVIRSQLYLNKPSTLTTSYHALPTHTNLLPQQLCFWFMCCFRWETRKNHQCKMLQNKPMTTRTKGAL